MGEEKEKNGGKHFNRETVEKKGRQDEIVDGICSLCVCLTVCLSVCPSVCLSPCLIVCLTICLFFENGCFSR